MEGCGISDPLGVLGSEPALGWHGDAASHLPPGHRHFPAAGLHTLSTSPPAPSATLSPLCSRPRPNKPPWVSMAMGGLHRKDTGAQKLRAEQPPCLVGGLGCATWLPPGRVPWHLCSMGSEPGLGLSQGMQACCPLG